VNSFANECLNEQLFEEIARWRGDYNEVKLRSSISRSPPTQVGRPQHRRRAGDAGSQPETQ
jgi:hypothetical protein